MPSMPSGGLEETDSYQTDIEEFPGKGDREQSFKGVKTFSSILTNVKTKSSKYGN
jgi:hypothetical protein